MSGNDNNRLFYNKVPLHVFQALTHDGGFDQCIDLQQIKSDIASTVSVLEVGAGYGRCVDFLLQQKHVGKIWAVEQSPQFSKILVDKYREVPNVEVITADIKSFTLETKTDVILWLFSGLLDFSKEEQLDVLKRLRHFLVPNGVLFLDIPQLAALTIAKYVGAQDIVMETPYGSIQTFLPTLSDIESYAQQAGYSKVTVANYNTTTGKKRSMFKLYA